MPFYLEAKPPQQKSSRTSYNENREPLKPLPEIKLNASLKQAQAQRATEYKASSTQSVSMNPSEVHRTRPPASETEELPGSLWSARETSILVEIIEKDLDITSCFHEINRTEDAIKRKWRKLLLKLPKSRSSAQLNSSGDVPVVTTSVLASNTPQEDRNSSARTITLTGDDQGCEYDVDTSFSPACNECRKRHRKCPHRAEIPLPTVEIDDPEVVSGEESHQSISETHQGRGESTSHTTKNESTDKKRRGRPPKWLVKQRVKNAASQPKSMLDRDSEPYRPRKRRAIDDYEFSGKFDEIILQRMPEETLLSGSDEVSHEEIPSPSTCLDPLAELRKTIAETDLAVIQGSARPAESTCIASAENSCLSYFPLSSIRG